MESKRSSNDIVLASIDEDRESSNENGTVTYHTSTRSSLENNVDTENSNNRFGVDDGIRSVSNSNNPIIIAIKPILCILKVFGVYYSVPDNSNVIDTHYDDCRSAMLADCQLKKKRTRRTIFTPLRLYSLAVCFLLWINAGRFGANVFIYQNTSWMPFVILYVLWLFQVAGNVSLYYYMCHRYLYVTNLAKACFNLYRLIFNWSVNGLLMNITLIIWFIATTGMTIITSWVASILNAEAHSPISVLYSLQTRNIGNDGLAELLLFQSRLLAEPIGISIVGMFVITRSLILTRSYMERLKRIKILVSTYKGFTISEVTVTRKNTVTT
ncbi:uncharacterized protein TRIADDRAFT_54201 [Trichoplax adhaerens]|uniref:Uncharacterized protein n=1 Tax=Trichoplax adhaerens TaxID=10228 RepID=B3RRD9_TRIAD|nr:predicted protein [Trichoplax adhaerens]EDV26327.1 predicted protein [Trichoplax adhaerens]|eukprot:XP_002110323.1 predicted protein [Trichoplax adhaerens]